MSYGPVTVYSTVIASGATVGSAITMGRSFSRVYLQIPTLPSGTLYIQGSADGSTFRRITKDQGNTATVHVDFSIDSSVSLKIVPIPNGMFAYKVELSTLSTNTAHTFKIICSD